MQSSLRPWQRTIIFALVILLHGSMLLLFVMFELEKQSSATLPDPMVISLEEQEPPLSEQELVALNNSLPLTQMGTAHQVVPEDDQTTQEADDFFAQHSEEIEDQKTEEAQREQKIEEALDLASQFLELPKPQEQKAAQQKETEEPKEIEPEKKMPVRTGQKLSFTQLAQGFANQIAQVNMAVESNRQGPADMGMIMFVNYCQKILSNIGDSYRITNHTAPQDKLPQDAQILMVLNRNGTIQSLNLVRSSGSERIDNYLLQLFKHASSSFPPAPTAIKEAPIKLPVFNIGSLSSLRHIHLWKITA